MKGGFVIGVIAIVIIVVAGALYLRSNSEVEDIDTEVEFVSEPGTNTTGSGQFLQEAPETVPAVVDNEALPVGTEQQLEDDTAVTSSSEGATTISITDTGFVPADVTVAVGDTVTFVNNGQAPHWPASAVHPTHTSYPGSGIGKCNAAEAASIFDACGGLQTGDQYSFTFTETGAWQYHDHLNPRKGGTVTVQ